MTGCSRNESWQHNLYINLRYLFPSDAIRSQSVEVYIRYTSYAYADTHSGEEGGCNRDFFFFWAYRIFGNTQFLMYMLEIYAYVLAISQTTFMFFIVFRKPISDFICGWKQIKNLLFIGEIETGCVHIHYIRDVVAIWDVWSINFWSGYHLYASQITLHSILSLTD